MTPDADARWMALAVSLARRARPAPNPPVGAVIVKGSRLVAWGWHERAGSPHAEAVALQDASTEARGATLYVTLEPCNHYGRTPPCADAVLAAGVARVVIGCRDPNPLVRGGGAERIRAHGVVVQVGTLAGEARSLIDEWVGLLGRRCRPLSV